MITPSLSPAPIRARFQPLNRWAFGLTPLSITLLLTGFAGLLPGFWDPRLAYSMLAWDFLVLLIALLDLLRLPAPGHLSATRSWSNAPALDSATEIELTLENQGSLILDCRLVDELPAALTPHPGTHRLLAFPRVAASLRYLVEPRERGDWATGWLFVRYRSGLGLVERWAKAPLAQSVRIYPALRTGEQQQIFLARSRQIDLELRQARLRGLGRDFESLRDYRPGDDLRDICWTATARRGGLISRQYQTERSQPVWIVVDCGRLMRTRIATGPSTRPSAASSQASGQPFARAETARDWTAALDPDRTEARNAAEFRAHSKLDHAATTAVALAQLALFSGDRVGLLAYGQGIQQRLLPGRGATHLRQLIDALSQVRAEAGEADHLRATATLNRLQPRRSLILWITDLAETAMRPEVIDGAVQLLRRHVLLFVAMAQPEVESIAHARPNSIDQMFRAAAAQEMASRRDLLLARLQEHGALTLDLNPEALTSSVLNQYLTIKERAII
jgi:uncharacterized protein (DUF58 family)